MDKPVSPFDWVSARNACSTRAVFDSLKLGATGDVKVINSLRGKPVFTLETAPSRDLFSVVSQEGSPQRTVSFSLADTEIAVKTSSGASFRVTLALNDIGECKVKIKGRDEELELWQVLRIALEELFFHSPA
ncbi:MAG: hypothetical protein WCC87_20250 [Candidatus Korobacteraceae bacterium]